jgi:putative tributyrin esterase
MASGIRNPVLSEELPGHPGVRLLTLYSPALRHRADMTLYLPPTAAERPLPLLILMHGVSGSHWNWWALGNLPAMARALLAAAEIVPFVIAMPSDGMWSDGSGYVAHKRFDAESWIIDDIPSCLRELFPQIRTCKVFLAGLSMGGFGALRIGAKHAPRVAGISAHSPVTRLADLQGFVQDSIGKDLAAEHSDARILYWMRRNRSCLPPIRFDCGTDDTLLTGNRALHTAMLRARIPHEYEEHPGGHDWAYWQQQVRTTLRFVSRLASQSSEFS